MDAQRESLGKDKGFIKIIWKYLHPNTDSVAILPNQFDPSGLSTIITVGSCLPTRPRRQPAPESDHQRTDADGKDRQTQHIDQ